MNFITHSLQNAPECFGEILGYISDAVITADTTGRLTFLNSAAERLSGWQAALALGKPVNDVLKIFQSATRLPMECPIRLILAQGCTMNYSKHWLLNAADSREIAIEGQAVGIEGGVLLILRDIGERERFADLNPDRQRIHALRLKLEESSRHYVARQTAAAIAHELNQPLTALSLFTTGALQLLRSGVIDTQLLEHALVNSEQQAQRAGHIINELLSQLHRDESTTEASAIETILDDSLSILKDNAELDGVKVIRHIASGLAPVLINRLQIKKVIVNLLRNAVQAMQPLEMPNPEIDLIAEPMPGDKTLLRLTVRDSGQGLEDQDLLSIFQPFYSTKAAGLGMGLAVSQSVIESHGGTLWAESNAGRSGASFYFTLPFAE